MNNPFEETDTSKRTENDLDATIFTTYTSGDRDVPPVRNIKFMRYYADGNVSMTLNVSEKSVNNMYVPILCNLTELAVSLYCALRNPGSTSVLHEYETNLSSLKLALHAAYTNKKLHEQYVQKYTEIYRKRYGWNIALMGTILLRYAELVQPWVVSTSQRGVSAYEKARNDGKREGNMQ